MFPWFLVGKYVAQAVSKISSAYDHHKEIAEERRFAKMSLAEQSIHLAERRRLADEAEERERRARSGCLIFFVVAACLFILGINRACQETEPIQQELQPSPIQPEVNANDLHVKPPSLATRLAGCGLIGGAEPTKARLDGLNEDLIGLMDCPDSKTYAIVEKPGANRRCGLQVFPYKLSAPRFDVAGNTVLIYLNGSQSTVPGRAVFDFMLVETKEGEIRAFNENSEPVDVTCETMHN